jgi:arylsulfatase A-like enzyme
MGLALSCGGPTRPRPALPAPGAAAGHNLILVTLDTTRADHLGCYGYDRAQTPTLDNLAAGGLRFARAFTTAPVTLPAHASIVTGLLPVHHGVRHNSEYRLADDHRTLAEVLREAGYATGAFVGAFILDARYGLAQGFDTYDDRVATTPGGTFPVATVERPAGAVTDAALAWLASVDPARPFFAWVHYFDPHAPYAPPADLAGRFAAMPYDGEIAYVDRELGRLLGFLETAGARSRTVVVAVGDHGEGLGEHGEALHALFIYDTTMRVPLILAAPGVVSAGVDEELVSVVDLVPTLLDLLAVADPVARDGLDLLRDDRAGRRAVALESLPPFLDYGWAPLFGERGRDDKYIAAPRPEYYDLAADPDETTNLAGNARGRAAAAREELAARVAALVQGSGHGAPGGVNRLPDSDEIARLRSLGYLGGAGPASGTPPDPKDMVHVVAAVLAANQLLAAGNARAALEMAETAARQSPGDRTVLQLLGKLYLQVGRTADAERALRAFTAIKPKADVSLLLAQILIASGRLDEAGALLDQAEALEPRHGGVAIARGDLLAVRGRPAEALAAYRHAAEIDPYRARGMAEARATGLAGARVAMPAQPLAWRRESP